MEQNIKNVLTSRRFWVLVIGAVVMILVAAIPGLQSAEGKIIDSMTLIVMLAIGGYSLDRIAIAWLAKEGNVELSVKALGSGVDYLEERLSIDIPDTIEDAAREELRKRLQAIADSSLGASAEITVDEP